MTKQCGIRAPEDGSTRRHFQPGEGKTGARGAGEPGGGTRGGSIGRNERVIHPAVQSSKSGSRWGGHGHEDLSFVPRTIHRSSRKAGHCAPAGVVFTGLGSHPGKVTLKGVPAVECWAGSPLQAHSDGELHESLKAIFSTSLLSFPGEYIHVFFPSTLRRE